MIKKRAPKNRTITITGEEKTELLKSVISVDEPVSLEFITNRLIRDDFFESIRKLPQKFVDLLILDPPYNLNKSFNSNSFKKMNREDYSKWFEDVIVNLLPILKDESSIYVCSDWLSSTSIYPVLEKYFFVRNRITWEREKGRGAKTNWKNSSEDIWFCTNGSTYYFNVDAVKLKRRVLAPYRNELGEPKDWNKDKNGNYRLTHPSNLWTDISVPFWSMPENTDHPTQKPEKLIAKLILASSRENDFVFDPFAGSGTTLVTAKKLNRKFAGIELDEEFAALAVKRLKMADEDKSIQGYLDGVFTERNYKP